MKVAASADHLAHWTYIELDEVQIHLPETQVCTAKCHSIRENIYFVQNPTPIIVYTDFLVLNFIQEQ